MDTKNPLTDIQLTTLTDKLISLEYSIGYDARTIYVGRKDAKFIGTTPVTPILEINRSIIGEMDGTHTYFAHFPEIDSNLKTLSYLAQNELIGVYASLFGTLKLG